MRILWIIICLLTILPVYSQQESIPLRFQKITIEQGLPHNYVHTIAQDKKGFIWIGTNYGLVRFDGYNFKVFQPNPQKPHSITHKAIGKVLADSRGYLWLSVNGGVNRMDLQTEQFTSYFFDATNHYPIGNYFRFFHEDSDSNIWLATNNGIFYYNREQDKFIYTFLKKKFKTTTNDIKSLTDDNNGNIWFNIDDKIGILNKKTFDVHTIGEFTSDSGFDTLGYHHVFSNEKGIVWLSTYHSGLIRIDTRKHLVEYYLQNIIDLANIYIDKNGNIYTITNNPVYNLFVCRKQNIKKKEFEMYPLFEFKTKFQQMNLVEDQFNNIWIWSAIGFAKFNYKNGLTFYKPDLFLPYSVSDNNVEFVFIDRTDNLWICPFRKGINKADLNQKPFKLHSLPINKLEDISKDKNVSCVFKDSKNDLWFSDSNFGISVYNKASGKYYRYSLNSNNAVTAIFEDIDGDMWLGTSWDVLYKVKPKDLKTLKGSTNITFSNIESYNIQGVRNIVMDNSKNLWFVTLTGLVEYNRSNKEFINYSVLYDSLNNFSSFYRALFIDKKGIIWTGSNDGGLCKFEKSRKYFKHYLHDSLNNQSISSNTVYCIYPDKYGFYWIGTGQGLEKFDSKTEVFEHAGIKDELYKRSIFSIIPDTLGNLWMSCDIGIICYNIETKQSSFYGQADGLQNNEFNTTASFVDKTGEIFYGGSKGLVSFYPSSIKPNPIHAKPVITNILIHNKAISPGDSMNGRVILQKQVWETNEISLYYHENEFTIEFSALHFSAPEKVNYQYKLEGFNSDWVYTDSKRRYASYTGLQPGEYTFILKATNNDGLMCEPKDEVHLSIIIIPPFWQTIWFKLLVILIISALILLFIWYRVRTLRNQNNLLNKKVKERTSELTQANIFLEERTHELEEANIILEERQEEINLQKEEILTQYETLESNTKILEQHQKQIIEQNIELDKHRNNLEFLVEERTKELEKALLKAKESDMLKTSFLTNISHEIRTPMNAIIGFSSLLHDKDLIEKHSEFIDIISSNGMTLLRLIDDILELSSLQTQQLSLKPINNNLYTLLKKIYETHLIEINLKKLELKLNTNLIKADHHMIFDEIRLKQVFSNLISNACKFTNTGYIEFGIFDITDKITFYVKDTGIGIEKDIGNAIFDRFYKIEKTNNQLYRGTGLGLAICKGIVSLMGGEIWYDSEIDKGTTFYFSHPISIESINETDQSNNNENQNPDINLTGKKILIAEDEVSNFKLLESYFIKTHAEILWAENGLEAIKIANNNSIDLVLMDIKMPYMNGIVAANKIREQYPELPIIAQTAYSFKNEIEEIINSGFQDYIIKPIQKPKLFDLVRKYLLPI